MMYRIILLTLMLVTAPAWAEPLYPHFADGTVYCWPKDKNYNHYVRPHVGEVKEVCDLDRPYESFSSGKQPPSDGWYDPDTGQVTQEIPRWLVR